MKRLSLALLLLAGCGLKPLADYCLVLPNGWPHLGDTCECPVDCIGITSAAPDLACYPRDDGSGVCSWRYR